jgi:hypothetical protein
MELLIKLENRICKDYELLASFINVIKPHFIASTIIANTYIRNKLDELPNPSIP